MLLTTFNVNRGGIGLFSSFCCQDFQEWVRIVTSLDTTKPCATYQNKMLHFTSVSVVILNRGWATLKTRHLALISTLDFNLVFDKKVYTFRKVKEQFLYRFFLLCNNTAWSIGKNFFVNIRSTKTDVSIDLSFDNVDVLNVQCNNEKSSCKL
jgi:hypothetical protein